MPCCCFSFLFALSIQQQQQRLYQQASLQLAVQIFLEVVQSGQLVEVALNLESVLQVFSIYLDSVRACCEPARQQGGSSHRI